MDRDYANLNNKISISISKSHGDLIQFEKEIFEMKIKQEITIPPLQDFIYDWLDKQLAVVVKTTWPRKLQTRLLFEGLHRIY